MPLNDFKPFAIAAGANVLSQADYNALAAVSTGWQSGVAKSPEVNKAVRQATFIAAAVAQYVAELSGQDVLDDGNVANFITKLKLANSSQFLGNGKNLSEISLAGPDSQGVARGNLGLGSASIRATEYFLQTGNNLIEIQNAGLSAQSSARGNLGLGSAALRATEWFLQSANNLIEIQSAGSGAQASARSNLGINSSATRATEYFFQAANNLIEIKNSGAPAQNSARGNLGLGTAAIRATEYFLQVANNLIEIQSAGPLAQAAARNNLALGTAATRTVGVTGSQIPDMTGFISSTGSQPYQYLPSGLIIQAGYSTTNSSGVGQISFAQSFNSGRPIVIATPTATSPSNYIATVGGASNSGCTVYCTAANSGSVPVTGPQVGFSYLAFGY